jgi:non-heme chloroperoxidase
MRNDHASPYRKLMFVLPVALACGDGSVVASASAHGLAAAAADIDVAAPVVGSEVIAGGGGLKLTVYEGGSASGPPIVFIHGFTGSYLSWQTLFASQLANGFRLIAYDLRGHGASDKPLETAKYTDGTLWAQDVDAVIREKHLDHPVLVGWSYGGSVIADYLRQYGDDGIGGLVFVGAVTKAGTPEANSYLTNDALAIFPDVLSADVHNSIEATVQFTRMFGNPLRLGLWEQSFGTAMMVPAAVRVAMWLRVLDNDDVLARIRVPTLVIQGGADRLVRMTAATHIAAVVPEAKLLAYEGVGHAVQLDAPQRLARDLTDFVRAVRHHQH